MSFAVQNTVKAATVMAEVKIPLLIIFFHFTFFLFCWLLSWLLFRGLPIEQL
jgi:uncharacterized membrane protein